MTARCLVPLVLVATLAGCVTPSPNLGTIAGDWRGRISTPTGHTGARLTVGADGRYTGTAFFDGVDRPLYGAIVALPNGRLRYVGSEGDGDVTLRGDALRLRGDDGATGGVFRRP
jgi:hypothetical protein